MCYSISKYRVASRGFCATVDLLVALVLLHSIPYDYCFLFYSSCRQDRSKANVRCAELNVLVLSLARQSRYHVLSRNLFDFISCILYKNGVLVVCMIDNFDCLFLINVWSGGTYYNWNVSLWNTLAGWNTTDPCLLIFMWSKLQHDIYLFIHFESDHYRVHPYTQNTKTNTYKHKQNRRQIYTRENKINKSDMKWTMYGIQVKLSNTLNKNIVTRW